jgi:hypothetical protein
MREAAAVAVNLYDESAYVWREVADPRNGVDGVRMAPAGRNTWVVMEHDEYGYHPSLLAYPGFGSQPTLSPLAGRPLSDLGYAMAMAEQAAAPFTEDAGFHVRRGGWRDRQEPPTGRQLEAARRLRLDPGLYPTKSALSEALDVHYFLRAYRTVRGRTNGRR